MPPARETAAANPPALGSVTGLGSGGASLVLSPFGEAWFDVELVAGAGVSSSGGFVLTFSDAPRTMRLGIPQGLGAVTQNPEAVTITVAWTGAHLVPGSRQRLHFEWTILQ